ncbi:DUF222 domain-containing protein [Nocardioides caeni]|uniref:DUF222 domain-containing protein n=1 Tax=Nocardioides caeni TaxID=574700 RepID=A0A4S8N0H6_9ACTN|nr:HNH endonuclease signature motif containing protein [Nocardioides caeni]THV09243.1 DUF222 domain-containing protein [Nocardioides caeni]
MDSPIAHDDPPAGSLRAAGVAAAAGELVATDWSAVPSDDLPAMVADIARAQAMLGASLLAVADRLGECDAVQELGWASVKDFLTHMTGGHKGSGSGIIRTAGRLRHLPAVKEALEEGRISMDQTRAIATQVSRFPLEQEIRSDIAGILVEKATQGLDASDLVTSVPAAVREYDPDGSILSLEADRARNERNAHANRFLSFTNDIHGGVSVRGYATIEDVERIKTVLMPLSAPVASEPGACGGVPHVPGAPILDDDGQPIARSSCPEPGCAHDGSDPREHGVRLWDALVELAERARATDDLPHDHGARPRIVVTIDHERLRRDLADTNFVPIDDQGRLGSGQLLSAGVVRRLACDAEILPVVLGSESEVLDVGRSHRLVTPALWNALVLRDRHCAFPGCSRLPLACDAHHIVHWADGGVTSLANLIMLCRHHHTTIHRSPWTVAIDPATGRPVWTRPPGARIARLGPMPAPHAA